MYSLWNLIFIIKSHYFWSKAIDETLQRKEFVPSEVFFSFKSRTLVKELHIPMKQTRLHASKYNTIFWKGQGWTWINCISSCFSLLDSWLFGFFFVFIFVSLSQNISEKHISFNQNLWEILHSRFEMLHFLHEISPYLRNVHETFGNKPTSANDPFLRPVHYTTAFMPVSTRFTLAG